jgi:molybdate transport system ATP-binding protein
VGSEVLTDVATGVHRPLEQRRIGWVFQDGRLFPHLRVAQNLDYGARRRRPAEPGGTARNGSGRGAAGGIRRDHVIEVLGIGALLGRWPRDLSGGERQRVAIGRALLSQPRLLLLDEPLASLDAPRKAEILAFLERVKAEFELPMLYVTHSLAEVLRLADHLVLLDAGRVIEQGAALEVIGRADTPLLAQRPDSGALVECVVAAHDPASGTTRLALGTQELVLPTIPAAAGARVRAYVLANEVILATEQPRGLSVRNALDARLLRILPRADGTALVELAVDGHRLLAAVTQGAVRELALQPGMSLFALVKSVAVDAPAGARLL